MQRASRRDVIKTTGVGTGVALGAGAVGAQQNGQFGSVATTAEKEVLTSFEANLTEVGITLDTDSPGDTFDIPVGEITEDFGGEATIAGEIYEDGTWQSTVVEIPDGIDIALWLGLDTVVGLVLDWLDVEGFLQDTDLDEVVDWAVDLVGAIGFDESQAAGVTDLVDTLLNEIGVDLPDFVRDMVINALEDFLANPDADTINDILDMLDIQTLSDVLDLVGIDVGELDQFVMDLIADLEPEELLGDFGLGIDVTEITGQYNPEANQMSATFDDVSLSLSYEGDQVIGFDSPVGLGLTTEQSGDVSGDSGNLMQPTSSLTLVNNEFQIGFEEFGLQQLIDVEDIASPIAWLLDLIFDVSTQDVADVLDSIGLDDVLESANLDTFIDWLFDDEAGRHAIVLELDQQIAEPDSLTALVSPPPIVGDAPPVDRDGDGLYEDIRGDGEANVFDVQALFDNLDDESVQRHSEKFNFSGQDEGEVNVFDVQALLEDVGGQ